jgi:hypothetical protein
MPPATCEAVNAETPHASLGVVVVMPCSGGVEGMGDGGGLMTVLEKRRRSVNKETGESDSSQVMTEKPKTVPVPGVAC